jgi:glutaredoxin
MGKKDKNNPEPVTPATDSPAPVTPPMDSSAPVTPVPVTPAPVSGSRWMMAGIIVIVVIIAMVGILYATGILGGSSAVPPEECGKTVISYVNTNLVAANATATLVSVNEKDGVYQIAARYQEQDVVFYATKNCGYIFSGIHNMKPTPTPTPASSLQPTPSPTTAIAPVKSARPSVELFVMSFCPYGVQAENLMQPVVGLFGTKANITVRYIANVQGTTVDSVTSLHGASEAKEDLRQLCIAKYYPQKVWPYLTAFNAQCYPGWQNATQLESCQKNVTATLGITDIETCASGSEGLALLKAEGAITSSYKVTGSPTLIINGQRYSGSRTTEAYKQTICARFETPPAECSVNLSAQTVAASGSC